MPPPYSVTDHPLLSEAVQALEDYPAEVEAHARIAETVLGLLGTTYTDDWALRATDFVARQVNYQVAMGVPYLKDKTQGARSWTYADVPVDPGALLGVELLADEFAAANLPSEGAFPAVTSFR